MEMENVLEKRFYCDEFIQVIICAFNHFKIIQCELLPGLLVKIKLILTIVNLKYG